jgi:hypothetical protein
MNRVFVRLILAVALPALLLGCANPNVERGAKTGAVGGAALGLTLGALTGDPALAAAGAVTGAAVGGASGAMYEYDQAKQDDRTMMMADAIAGRESGGSGETIGDVGRRHFADLLGDWSLDIWVLGAEGGRVMATGKAKGIQAGENAVRLLYSDIKAEGYDATVGGYSVLRYEPNQGFFLENSFDTSDEVLQFAGEYLADKNAYNYYLTNNTGAEMVSGILRSSVRVEIRVTGSSLVVAETYTHIDGAETKVQSYTFTRP